jgi:hypothetical protein
MGAETGESKQTILLDGAACRLIRINLGRTAEEGAAEIQKSRDRPQLAHGGPRTGRSRHGVSPQAEVRLTEIKPASGKQAESA